MAEIDRFGVDAMIIDPVSSLDGQVFEVNSAPARLIDFAKGRSVTCILTLRDATN